MSAERLRAGFAVDEALVAFLEEEALPGTGVAVEDFWAKLADLLARLTPRNRELLAKREELQSRVDAWHLANRGRPHDAAAYEVFLREIGYLAPEPEPFTVDTANVDPEIAATAGPQLVVPASNPRFALNAANARWGSLYDALYGTDALGAPAARPGGYDAERGARVVERAREILDGVVPGWRGEAYLVGWRGDRDAPTAKLLRHKGLHIELVFDRSHPVGAADPLGIADVILESALSTIVDLEDSVAAVDGTDKAAGYRTWLGLMKGTLPHESKRAVPPPSARWPPTANGRGRTVRSRCRGAACSSCATSAT